MYQIGSIGNVPVFAKTSFQTAANVFGRIFRGMMKLPQLAIDQSKWSQATFGTDAERGPIGPLKHLALEAVEAQENPKDVTEYADCLLLILDASRRAGFHLGELIEAAVEKQAQNKLRTWAKPTSDEPVMHEK